MNITARNPLTRSAMGGRQISCITSPCVPAGQGALPRIEQPRLARLATLAAYSLPSPSGGNGAVRGSSPPASKEQAEHGLFCSSSPTGSTFSSPPVSPSTDASFLDRWARSLRLGLAIEVTRRESSETREDCALDRRCGGARPASGNHRRPNRDLVGEIIWPRAFIGGAVPPAPVLGTVPFTGDLLRGVENLLDEAIDTHEVGYLWQPLSCQKSPACHARGTMGGISDQQKEVIHKGGPLDR